MDLLSENDLVNAIGRDMVLRLFDDDNDGTSDGGPLSSVLEDAEAECMGYATRNYSVVQLRDNPPATLRRLAVDVAIHLAYLRKPEFLNDKGETPWEQRYKRALEKLREIAKGAFRLDLDDQPEKPANVRGAGVRTGTFGNSVAVGEGFIKGGTGSGGF
jgi:phage gp36-like protein